MDRLRDCHTEWSKSDREGEIYHDIFYIWNLKRNDTNELTYSVAFDIRCHIIKEFCQRENV